ncbi:hypothetical protein KAT82_01695 [bacterium]|nr:hypothetical protein [bacterium]
MMRFPIRRLAVCMLLAVFALTLGGCWNPFAPEPGDPVEIPDADYHDRLTPEDVLHNLQTAYIWMNSVEYLDCLSEDFEFYPHEDDVNDPELDIDPVWWKPNEREMHENMFSDDPAISDVANITLTLTICSLEYDYGVPDDPLDDTCICIVDVDLRLNLVTGDGFLATAPSEFRMRIDIDQPNPEPDPEDVLWWEINCWFDLGDRGGGRGDAQHDPNVERVSLSELKSLFME